MAEWKDQTSYSQSEPRAYRVPRSWGLDTGKVRISVHRHIAAPGLWFVSCPNCRIEARELESNEADEAMAEGLEVVRARLTEMLASLPGAASDNGGA